MAFHAHILTLYPEMFPGSLGFSLVGKALERRIWSFDTIPIRDFATDKRRSVDDRPAGGGAGMVMKADVLARAIDSTPIDFPRFLMSPRGTLFTQSMARELSHLPGITFVCGRFEGVDERIIEARNLIEISAGDYILSGGEAAALILLDAIIRLLPSVMGNIESSLSESHETCLLEYPHYTRPQVFEKRTIPEILVSGNHKAIAVWRRKQAEQITRERRPDLWNCWKKKERKA